MKRIAALFLCVFLVAVSLPVAAQSTGLENKTALFIGDSIAAGWRDTGYGHANYSSSGGWSLRLQKNYQMQVTPAAQPGQSLTVIDRRGHIVEQLHKYKRGSYDYVILQGGFNDCMGENTPGNNNMAAIPKLGTVSQSFKVEDFDTTTFSGAFEELLYYAVNYFPTAKIGFIVTYQTPKSEYGGITDGIKKTPEGYTQADYFKRQMELCDKWKVPYLDLWDGTAHDGKKFSGDVIDVSGTSHFPGGSDHIHLSTAGYDVITPYIARWMVELAGGTFPTTTTTTTTTAKTTTTTTAAVTTTTTTTKAPVMGNTTTTTTTGTTTTTATTTTKEAVTTIVTRPTQETVTETSGDNSTTVTVVLICVIAAVLLTAGAVVTVILVQRKKSLDKTA